MNCVNPPFPLNQGALNKQMFCKSECFVNQKILFCIGDINYLQ